MRHHRRRRIDVGRLAAQLLCVVFAVIGALPLAAGFLVRAQRVQAWASAETSRLIHELLGVQASYDVELSLWPLELSLLDVSVTASDGGGPAFAADRIAITPRVFSLLAGRLDAGDIAIDQPKARIVLRDGAVKNVAYRLPKSDGEAAPELTRAPFGSIAITDAAVNLDVDGTRIEAGPMDLDIFAERGPAFEIALRMSHARVQRHRQQDEALPPATDDDVLCQLDLRVRFDRDGGLVRRLSLIGVADDDPARNTTPQCRRGSTETEANRIALRLSQVRVLLGEEEPKLIHGHVVVRAPVGLANRLGGGGFYGWVGFVGDVHYEAGDRLPTVRGKVSGGDIGMNEYRFSKQFDADLEIRDDVIYVPKANARYGRDGQTVITDFKLEPLADGVPIHVGRVDGTGVRFQDFMEDIGVTNNTIVQWDLDSIEVTDFDGTIDPPHIEGGLHVETSNFEIFDKAYHRVDRNHMIGVRKGTVRGRFGVRPDSIQFINSAVTFGHSRLFATVKVGFDNSLWLRVGDESHIDLADASPIVDVPMQGKAKITANLSGQADEAPVEGTLEIQDFVFGGFPIGNVESAEYRLQNLKLDLIQAKLKSGASRIHVPAARIDFDANATLIADAVVQSNRLDLRDFTHMWRFDEDPRWAELRGKGRVDARVHYDLGGKLDRCDSGYLRVDGDLALTSLDLFDEHYDSANSAFDFRWFDSAASHLGLQLDVPSLTLTKGTGTLLGNLRVTDGAAVQARLVATGVPLNRLQALGEASQFVDGSVSAVAEVGGTLDALSAEVDAQISRLQVGRSTLPASNIHVSLVPYQRPLEKAGETPCGRPIPAPYDASATAQADGEFRVAGDLLGGQLALENVRVTREEHARVQGAVIAKHLDLGSIADISPEIATSKNRVQGRLSGRLEVKQLRVDQPGHMQASLDLDELWLGRSGARVEIDSEEPFSVSQGRMAVSHAILTATMPGGQKGVFDFGGTLSQLATDPRMDLTLSMRTTDLSSFASLLPGAERVRGKLDGKLSLTGRLSDPEPRGKLTLTGGEVVLPEVPATLGNLAVTVEISPDELRLLTATADMGGGKLRAWGGVPIKGTELGALRAILTARDVHVPAAKGVRMVVDADLETLWKLNTEAKSLPRVTGDVTIQSFKYTRKVTMNADISSLAKKGKRTQFESFDPENDLLDFNVHVRAKRPLEITNDLVDAKLEIDPQGLAFAGTNQRFGLRGQLSVVKGGQIRLRRNEFEITQGYVRFDDAERIAAKVDITAVTEYTRYANASQSSTTGGTGASATAGGATSGSTSSGGRWRIKMRAHGDAENLRVDLSSEPELSEDDIFLLLTLGLTRTELDQAQSASAGQSVALEALGRLTGADEAVTKSISVIDEFNFGSAYSSRTGRTEPTVTIGKRLNRRIRAYVTSGLTDSREVRSNLQWRLSPTVSVDGSWDNVNDISQSALGNLGADIRWRLEFE